MQRKALIAMSGGVDSSVAALLMKNAGYDCIGVTMKLYENEDVGLSKGHTCCSLDDVEDARNGAVSLKMPYYVFNFSDNFKEKVIDGFVRSYETGATPNPCIDCNRFLKFRRLFDRAVELGCDTVATGHYARIEPDENGRPLLKKALDASKDQSYVLWSITKEQLSHIAFPLGGLIKSETRRIAEENGFINAGKHDSQDICFVKNGCYADFITDYTKKTYPEGDFVDRNGKILGRHKGIIRYTVGQRKGLGISFGEPMYVVKVDPESNTVVLGHEDELFSRTLTAGEMNLLSVDSLTAGTRYKAKVRYSQTEAPCTVDFADNRSVKITFDQPQRAITCGQSVVLYDGDIVVGGGIITGTE